MHRLDCLGTIRALYYIAGVALALTGASVVQATGDQPAPAPPQLAPTGMLPAWPNDGIAQRMFPNGSTMFVENDHGKLCAWVLSETTGGKNVEALDFFSGQRMKVKADLEKDGRQDQSFTDAKGDFHSNVGREFEFSGTSLPIGLPGISFDGNTVFLKGSINYCSGNITAATPAHNGAADPMSTTWSKFAIYHWMGTPKVCPGGSFNSKITSALDLNDGTFLAVEGCFIFHLRKSDLSPVGLAPALRVIDESVLQTAINQTKGKITQDAIDYLTKALNLPTGSELSCKND